jgi:hypothetical protein
MTEPNAETGSNPNPQPNPEHNPESNSKHNPEPNQELNSETNPNSALNRVSNLASNPNLNRADESFSVSNRSTAWVFEIRLYQVDSEGQQRTKLWETTVSADIQAELFVRSLTIDQSIEPGFYEVECTARSEAGETRQLQQGFWGFDEELLAEGSPLTTNRDYFEKEGKPFPVVGMTYMTSDVARKFLFMPNAAVWDKDMAQMKKACINMIRTGIWTAWRNMMFVDGHPSEEVLRALDAFMLTAKKHRLEVAFNIFSFVPEAWEGENPYLDPRSVEAQKRFIAALVSRYRKATHVHWDLINEPTVFDPKRVFQGPRSAQDRFEKEAFQNWIKARYSSIEQLQSKWNMTPVQLPDFDAVTMPEPWEINFNMQDMSTGKKGTRWLDYTLFTMEMHNRWAETLSATIRYYNEAHLITVGQDEALATQRPTPFFYAEAVDYTSVHSWWLNDHLVWDGIFTKTPYKPNLIQETGIMYVENPDGQAKRSEAELRNFLERKYALAFSTGGAGAIQWLWNTNFYMDNINESNIGALRADGTEKPEADVSYDFGTFIADIADLFVDRQLEDVAVIYPYSNDFSNRKLAFEATTRLSRVLSYNLHIPFRALGEYHVQALTDQPPRLIIVPSAHNFSQEAFERLLDHVRNHGAALLWTGPLGLDAHWQPVERLQDVFGSYSRANVTREEALHFDGNTWPVSFGERRIAEIFKEKVAGSSAETHSDIRTESRSDARTETRSDARCTALLQASVGKGRIFWSPLPVELNEQDWTLVELYRYVLAEAGVSQEFEWRRGGHIHGLYGRKLQFAEGQLFIFVSEFAHDVPLEIYDPEHKKTYAFDLPADRVALFATDLNGQLRATYRSIPVQVQEATEVQEVSETE